MATSRIQLTYEPRTNGLSGTSTKYYIRVSVGLNQEGLTTPDALKTCLVITRGSSTADESLSRVGTYAEIVTTPLPELPEDVDFFESEDLPSDIQVGDTVRITTLPEEWSIYSLATVPFSTVVTAVDLINNRVQVATEFPAFANNLVYSILHVGNVIGTGSDGVANRDFSATPSAVEYRASIGYRNFDTDLTSAQAWRVAAESDAWDLVRAYDTSAYTTTPDTVIYEWT